VQVLACLLADAGDAETDQWIARLAEFRAGDAEAIRARLFTKQQKWPEAVGALSVAFDAWRSDPWTTPGLVNESVDLAQRIARESGQRELAERLFEKLGQQFAVSSARERRLAARVEIAKFCADTPFNALTREALDDYGPHLPWRTAFLDLHVRTCNALSDPRLETALSDFRRFLAHEPIRFEAGLPRRAGVENGP
ncbi:MAG TPA: hypothetical protein VFD27_12575, partial [Chthoniobacteraceae bacterium]|nr:hypothetical protein [Chthoniobacteraceae bacterium]